MAGTKSGTGSALVFDGKWRTKVGSCVDDWDSVCGIICLDGVSKLFDINNS